MEYSSSKVFANFLSKFWRYCCLKVGGYYYPHSGSQGPKGLKSTRGIVGNDGVKWK